MNLDKWLSKTPKERNYLRRRWVEHELVRFSPLLEDARRRFEGEFGKHPLVVRVGINLARHEPCIEIVTSLWSPERIEELPDRYCTFWVFQEQVFSRREERLTYWRLVLQHVLGWSRSRVKKWTSQFEERLSGKSDLYDVFYHKSAASYVVRALIPERFAKKHQGTTKYWGLRNQLWAALEPPQRGNCISPQPMDSIYDWNAARKRVRKVLAKCGNR